MKLKQSAYYLYQSGLGIVVEIAYSLILILAAFVVSLLILTPR